VRELDNIATKVRRVQGSFVNACLKEGFSHVEDMDVILMDTLKNIKPQSIAAYKAWNTMRKNKKYRMKAKRMKW
jgi:hypothetical protein